MKRKNTIPEFHVLCLEFRKLAFMFWSHCTNGNEIENIQLLYDTPGIEFILKILLTCELPWQVWMLRRRLTSGAV